MSRGGLKASMLRMIFGMQSKAPASAANDVLWDRLTVSNAAQDPHLGPFMLQPTWSIDPHRSLVLEPVPLPHLHPPPACCVSGLRALPQPAQSECEPAAEPIKWCLARKLVQCHACAGAMPISSCLLQNLNVSRRTGTLQARKMLYSAQAGSSFA
eukprot:1156673-Pelagomonas_calceolata.AAC.8